MKTNKNTPILMLLLFSLLLSQITFADSILERVMKVEDPELADCMRVAVENIPLPDTLKIYSPDQKIYKEAKSAYDEQRLQVVRAITETYAQIKLLDTQIQQIEVKLHALSDSAFALRHELILAQAELKSKQIQQLAQLREIMGIIPRYAFGQIQLPQLQNWFFLDVLDENTVLIFHAKKPFNETWSIYGNYDLDSIRNTTGVMDYITPLIKQPTQRPLRIDILHFPNTPAPAQQIHTQLIQAMKTQQIEMDIDLRMTPRRAGSERSSFIIANHLGYSYRERNIIKKNRRTSGHELTRLYDPNTLPESINNGLMGKPDHLPLTWTLEYDPNSLELAQYTAQKITAIATDNGIQDYVQVKLTPTDRQWLPPKEWQANR